MYPPPKKKKIYIYIYVCKYNIESCSGMAKFQEAEKLLFICLFIIYLFIVLFVYLGGRWLSTNTEIFIIIYH